MVRRHPGDRCIVSPVDPGAILNEGSGLFRAHWRHFVSIAALVFVPVALLTLILSGAGAGGQLVILIISLVGSFLVFGAVVLAVDDVRDGRVDLTVRATLEAALAKIGPIMGASILAGIAIAFGFVLFIIPGLILLTIWIALVPVIVLEGSRVMAAFGRSRALVRGYGWPVFGLVLLTVVLLFIANLAFGIILGLFGLPTWLAQGVSSFVGNAVLAPWVAVIWTVAYFRLRELKPKDDAGAPPPAPAVA